jgi:hypothetical protein
MDLRGMVDSVLENDYLRAREQGEGPPAKHTLPFTFSTSFHFLGKVGVRSLELGAELNFDSEDHSVRDMK